MKRASMKKAESPVGLSYFFCSGKTCDRENCLVRCHSLEDARKDPLVLEFTAKIEREILATNGISDDSPAVDALDRCQTLEEAKEDPLVREFTAKLKNKVYVKSWEDDLLGRGVRRKSRRCDSTWLRSAKRT